MTHRSSIANALTIAGSDSGGGAGIQADLKAFSACGVYGASVITALTAQNTQGVDAIQTIPVAFVLKQLQSVFTDIRIDAVKTGMLGDAEMVQAIANFWRTLSQTPALVVDPVMVAKSGGSLLQESAVSCLKSELLPQATLITPNLPEAAVILGCSEPDSEAAMQEVAEQLLETGAKAVLLKGGHLIGQACPDLLYDGVNLYRFESPRIATSNTHGTGCTLASTIAAELAKGECLRDAVSNAKQYITSAISHADQLCVGSGHGPVHHFHALWPSPESQFNNEK